VRQTRENTAAGHVLTRVIFSSVEIAEKKRHLLRAVISIGLSESMRADDQLPAESAVVIRIMRFGFGRQIMGRPNAYSKCSMVFMATA